MFGKQKVTLEDGMNLIVEGFQNEAKDNWQEMASRIQRILDSWEETGEWDRPSPELGASELGIGCTALAMLLSPNKWVINNRMRYITAVRQAAVNTFGDWADRRLREYGEAHDLTVANWDNPLKKMMLVSTRFGIPLEHQLESVGCVLYDTLGIPSSETAIEHIQHPKNVLILMELNNYINLMGRNMVTRLFDSFKVR